MRAWGLCLVLGSVFRHTSKSRPRSQVSRSGIPFPDPGSSRAPCPPASSSVVTGSSVTESFFLKHSLTKLVSSLSSSPKTVPKLHVEEGNFWPPGGLKTCLFLSVSLTHRHARLLVPR